jgi:Ca2+-binding RTX toxin-like protein
MKFNDTPSSLKTLGRTQIEKDCIFIEGLAIDLKTGFIHIERSSAPNGGAAGFNVSKNIYEDSLIEWERFIGTENLGLIVKLRKIGIENNYYNNYSNMEGMLTYRRLGDHSLAGDSPWSDDKNYAQDFTVFSLPNNEESIQYGDYIKNSVFSKNEIFYNDYLSGWKNTDELYGLLGNDTLDGQGGDDVLYGGYGKDILLGGAGNDVLYGEQSNDSILGGAGNDYLDGGLGLDTMNGGEGNDTYLIDNPKDVVIDGNGIETILIPVYMNFVLPNNIERVRLTGNEDISATGNSLNNTLTGNEGENSLNGAIGNDTINAGSGDDTLTGGSGKDIMSGGVGSDVFSFQSVTESDIVNANAFDMIKDFNLSEGDKINLSAIDAKSGGTANDSFSFYSSAPKTAGASSNGAVWFSNGFLFASNDTDIQAEFKVAMKGISNISASNIIL